VKDIGDGFPEPFRDCIDREAFGYLDAPWCERIAHLPGGRSL